MNIIEVLYTGQVTGLELKEATPNAYDFRKNTWHCPFLSMLPG